MRGRRRCGRCRVVPRGREVEGGGDRRRTCLGGSLGVARRTLGGREGRLWGKVVSLSPWEVDVCQYQLSEHTDGMAIARMRRAVMRVRARVVVGLVVELVMACRIA